jgi:hypothetical protein
MSITSKPYDNLLRRRTPPHAVLYPVSLKQILGKTWIQLQIGHFTAHQSRFDKAVVSDLKHIENRSHSRSSAPVSG